MNWKKRSYRFGVYDVSSVSSASQPSKKRKQGHGRNGADAYSSAHRVMIQSEEYHSGDPCPECPKGRLYELSRPGVVIHVKGQPPLHATIYELQKYRCNLCGLVLTANLPKDFEVILTNCMAHARRHFVDLIHIFPDKCTHVIKAFREVYHHDKFTKDQNMSIQDRLEYHQQNSKPIMDDLKRWIDTQFDEKTIEPNSSLGKALKYMLNHWKPLTQFLDTPGCPLDNNIVERCLKSTIMHRKNSLFYKPNLGAHVGDIFMSIIQTCKLGKINTFQYLTKILKHSREVFKHPECWMPWNYEIAANMIES